MEIVGPIFGDGIWKPFRKLTDVEYKFVKVKGKLFPYLELQELARKISGDIIYASKPLFTSFLIGLMESKKRKNHLILDIDDWELGFVQESLGRLNLLDRLMSLGYSAIFPYKIGSYWNRFFCEKLVPLADEITVSNSFLHNKFGGIVVWQGRDKNTFDPRKFKKELLREKYDLDRSRKIVIFSGTPRPAE